MAILQVNMLIPKDSEKHDAGEGDRRFGLSRLDRQFESYGMNHGVK
jgi:hypothetical protein